jgi:hypothetical protein
LKIENCKLVNAGLAGEEEVHFVEARLVAGLALPEMTDGKLPDNIQWMPPGAHHIVASVDGEEGELDVTVTARDATRVAAQLQMLRSRAAKGEGDLPFFDFNHDDAEASAYPTEFYWGGDDAKTGGIRAKVEWSEPGAKAVLGKAYRRFSPGFGVGETSKAIQLKSVNLGGLVNRAAFQKIAPILSRHEGGDGKRKTNKPMDEKQMADLTASINALAGEVKEIKAKLAQPDPKLAVIETKLSGMEQMAKVQAKDRAKDIVAKHVKRGAIPPQDKALIEKWEGLIEVDAKNAELLDSMPDNPALAKITAGASGGGTATGNGGEHEFVVKAKAAAKAQNISEDKAFVLVATENPELYEQFRAALPKK